MIEAYHHLHLHLEVVDRWEMYPQDLRSQVHKDEQKPSGLWNFGVTLILLFARWTRPAMLMFSHMQAFNENEYPQKHDNTHPGRFKVLHQKLYFTPILVPQLVSSAESSSAVSSETSP